MNPLRSPMDVRDWANWSQKLQLSPRPLNLRVLFAAMVVGLLTGGLGASFRALVGWIAEQRSLLVEQLSAFPVLNLLLAMVVSGMMVALSFALMERFAPETGGSGIPQIEGELENQFSFPWQRILPVKFVGGLLTLGAGMLAGFEGPTIQMGGSIGQMVGKGLQFTQENRRILIAVGAGAGLASAFNAPLAGVLLIGEEMRPRFRELTLSYHALMVGCVLSTVLLRLVSGQDAVISLTQFNRVPLSSLWMFIFLGIFFGALGYWFNRCLFWVLEWFDRLPVAIKRRRGAALGAMIGGLSLVSLPIVGSGDNAIIWAFNSQAPADLFMLVFLARFLLTIFCYGSGAIGGIFAPMLALASLTSVPIARHFHEIFPAQIPEPAVMAIAGMGGLVAATVRAPLTAVLLTIEITDNYFVVLPLFLTCLMASIVAEFLGGQPVYTALLERLANQQSSKES